MVIEYKWRWNNMIDEATVDEGGIVVGDECRIAVKTKKNKLNQERSIISKGK